MEVILREYQNIPEWHASSCLVDQMLAGMKDCCRQNHYKTLNRIVSEDSAPTLSLLCNMMSKLP